MIGTDRFVIIVYHDNHLKTSAWADSLDASLEWMKRLKANKERFCLVDVGQNYETLGSRLMEFLVMELGINEADAKEEMYQYMNREMR